LPIADWSEEATRQLVSSYGSVTEVVHLTNADGSFKGSGFVKFGSVLEGLSAIAGIDGQMQLGSCPKPVELRFAGSRGGGAPAASSGPTEWTCPSCNNLNFPLRTQCNRCQLPRPAAAPQRQLKPGEWLCPSCTNVNFPLRTQCNRCQLPKPMHHAAMMPAAPQGVHGGDWTCPQCNNLNFASRTACNRCKVDKVAVLGMDNQGANWTCGSCQNVNFPKRTECNRCKLDKATSLAMRGAIGGKAPRQQGGGHPGEWICPSCNNLNFKSRTSCNRCQLAKPASAGQARMAPGGFGRRFAPF
jgi:hypothetical protein